MNHDDGALLTDAALRLFAAHDPARARPDEDSAPFPSALWRQLEEGGILDMLLPEARGGIAGSARELAAVLRIAGRFGPAGPLAETIVSRWLIAETGRDCPKIPLSLAIDGWTLRDGLLTAVVRRGPDPATDSTVVLYTADGRTLVRIAPISRLSPVSARNLAGEPLHALQGIAADVLREAHRCDDALSQRASSLLSLARAALLVGALERVMDLSLSHAAGRVQFGRPIGAFQAVQQQLASLAGAVAAATAITFAAARALGTAAGSPLLDAARIRLADSVDTVTTIAHQVHGAIGITREYSLQHFTRRLWAWRNESAAPAADRCRLAAQFRQCGADELWPHLVALHADGA